MILIVVSETDPIEAIKALFRRSAYVLIPISILLIKYYRESGIGYNAWTGAEMMIGVSTDKNGLGRLCLIFALYFIWST